MIKKYNDFILENFSSRNFESDYNEFISIYQNEIVPKIGEVKLYTNLLIDDVKIPKEVQSRFHKLRQKLVDARNEFSETIMSLCERFYRTSYSNLAARSSSDPNKDFEEMQNVINKSGFTIEILEMLFNPVVSIFTSEDFKRFIEKNSLDDQNGYLDIYLYKLNEKLDLNTTVWLGGAGWGDALNDNPEEEYVVRYSYGYHKTPYGKLLLDQMNISKESFIESAYLYLKDWIVENVFPGVSKDLKKMFQIDYSSTLSDLNLELEHYIDFDDDRFIIRYSELCDDFNETTQNKYLNTVNPEWIKESILSNMLVIKHLNIQDTGEELIFNE